MKPISCGYLIILLVILVACEKQATTPTIKISTPTFVLPAPVPTSTLMPFTITPSPLPTQPRIPIITPDPVQVERWREYEAALAAKLLPPNSLRGEVLCEWQLLGRSEQEVYVWALCQSPPYSAGMAASVASMPAFIQLGEDGAVKNVEIPGSGTAYAPDVREMFPVSVQEVIFNHLIDTKEMEMHIVLRRENPGPPLIVLSATPTP